MESIMKTARALAEGIHDLIEVFNFTDDEKAALVAEFCAHLGAVNAARRPEVAPRPE